MAALYLILTWWLQVCCVYSQTNQFTITMRNRQLRGYHLTTRHKVNKVVECIFECQIHQKCRSVNYHSGQQICQLNKIFSQILREKSLVDANGWTYFEKKEDAPEESRKHYFVIPQESKPEKGKLINIIPKTFSSWYLSMNITPRAFFDDGDRSIFQVAVNNETPMMETIEIPSIFLNKDKILIKYPLNREYNWTYTVNKSLVIGQTIQLRIEQQREVTNQNSSVLKFKIIIDGGITFEKERNKKATRQRKVECYLGSPFHKPAPVFIYNLRYLTWYDGNSISPFPYFVPLSSLWPVNKGRISVNIKRLTNEIFDQDRTVLKVGNNDKTFADMLKIQLESKSHLIKFLRGDQAMYVGKLFLKMFHQIVISYIAFGNGYLKMKFYFDNEQPKELTFKQESYYSDLQISMGDELMAAESIVFQDLEVYEPEEIIITKNNTIGEIPFQWPPLCGYLSFNISKKFSNNSNDDISNKTILNIKHPRKEKIESKLKVLAVPATSKNGYRISVETTHQTYVLGASYWFKNSSSHQINITYEPTARENTTIRIYFDGILKQMYTAKLHRYYDLKIYGADDENAATNFAVKDLQYHSQSTIKTYNGNFLGYIPFLWPPRYGYLRFMIMRIETTTTDQTLHGNHSEILTIAHSSGNQNHNTKYLVFSLNQETHQLNFVIKNASIEEKKPKVLQEDHGKAVSKDTNHGRLDPACTHTDQKCLPSTNRCLRLNQYHVVEIRFNTPDGEPTQFEVFLKHQPIFVGHFITVAQQQKDVEIYAAFESAADNTVIKHLIYYDY